MAVTKIDMSFSLSLPRKLPHPTTSSFGATKISVDGRKRRYVMGGLQLSASFRPSIRSVSATKLTESCHYDDVEDFVDGISSWNCIVSSHGWLGYVNPRNLSFYLFKLSLINDPSYLPYIILPPIQFPSEDPNAISKLVFSCSPTPISRSNTNHIKSNQLVVVVITLDWHGIGPAAAFCRIGDPNWATLANFPEESCSNNFQDIAYYSKHKLFYAVTDSGKIFSWKLSNYHWFPMSLQVKGNFRYLAQSPLKRFNPGILRSIEEIDNCKYYLVMDESSGALLVIRLHISYESEHNSYDKVSSKKKAYMHHIERLDLDRLEWFSVKDLVDTSLFIGRNNGIIADVREAPGSMMPGYVYLACNAGNVSQLTALPTYNMEGTFLNYIILRADDITNEDQMTSFPVWNFDIKYRN